VPRSWCFRVAVHHWHRLGIYSGCSRSTTQTQWTQPIDGDSLRITSHVVTAFLLPFLHNNSWQLEAQRKFIFILHSAAMCVLRKQRPALSHFIIRSSNLEALLWRYIHIPPFIQKCFLVGEFHILCYQAGVTTFRSYYSILHEGWVSLTIIHGARSLGRTPYGLITGSEVRFWGNSTGASLHHTHPVIGVPPFNITPRMGFYAGLKTHPSHQF